VVEKLADSINSLNVALNCFSRIGEKTMKSDGFKAYTMDELEVLARQEMAEWLKTRRVGLAEYDPEANIIKLHVYFGNSVYEVDLDRCKTQEELLHWVFHLLGKRWCKDSLLTDFFHCLRWAIKEREDKNLYAFFKA
jgi:hypothetical protein